MFGVPLVLMVAGGVVRGINASWWSFLAIFSSPLGLIFLWLSRFRLEIGPDFVAYSSLLNARREIQKSDIVHADFAKGTGPFEGIVIFVVRSRAGEELRINAKTFSREAVASLVNLGQGE